jgi:hypothetical protein
LQARAAFDPVPPTVLAAGDRRLCARIAASGQPAGTGCCAGRFVNPENSLIPKILIQKNVMLLIIYLCQSVSICGENLTNIFN